MSGTRTVDLHLYTKVPPDIDKLIKCVGHFQFRILSLSLPRLELATHYLLPSTTGRNLRKLSLPLSGHRAKPRPAPGQDGPWAIVVKEHPSLDGQ
jgi:hypothetical protein